MQVLKNGLRIAIQMFSWKPGGGGAGEVVHFVWRILTDFSDRDDNKASALQAECLKGISFYHSRVKKAVFLATVMRPSFV